MREADLLIKDYRVNGFYFSDETFTIDRAWSVDFCKEIKKRGLPWGCATRIDTVDDPLLKQMKESGCIQVDLGVESGSNRILETIKKNLTDKRIKEAFLLFKKNRIRTFATFMIGNPTETKEDIIKTRNMVRSIKPSFALFSWFTPFPGTEAYDWMIKDKNIDPNTLNTGYDFITSDKPMVNITDMTTEELVSSRSLLQRSVFIGNYLSMANKKYTDYVARVVQHEVDHLDGKLIVDYEGAIYFPRNKQKFYENLFNQDSIEKIID
jgi:radical SAM superfamily enzyme YgiQ (UPF0313 family)